MPSKTTSYTDTDYEYIRETMRDKQGFSDRVRELIRKGKGVEKDD